MAKTYTTKAGDQWDSIAKKVYGSEMHADFLMENNLPLLDIYEFDAGTVLKTPDLPLEQSNMLPPWRRSSE
jgi:phage tail protein X